MTKDEARSSVMGAISMALKDPILQQGFEIICKENAELNDKLNNLSKVSEVRLANWQKYEQENAELKAINEGYCRSRDRLASIGLPTFMSCKETVNKLKEAKDLIRNLLRVTYGEGWNYSLDVKVKAEDFLKECE